MMLKPSVTKDSLLVGLAKTTFAIILKIATRRTMLNGRRRATGESIYNERTLSIYDALVWKFNAPALWRIKKDEIRNLYLTCVGRKHCEIAVGTGLFVKDYISAKSSQLSHLYLLDLNEDTLVVAKRRITEAASTAGKEIEIDSRRLDITVNDSIPVELKGKFDSVAANFLFHCVHGHSLKSKEKVNGFKNCASLVNTDGCFFGSTILGKDLMDDGDTAGAAATNTMEFYNNAGIFGNKGDSMQDLEQLLNELFHDVNINFSGYCAVWKATKPKL